MPPPPDSMTRMGPMTISSTQRRSRRPHFKGSDLFRSVPTAFHHPRNRDRKRLCRAALASPIGGQITGVGESELGAGPLTMAPRLLDNMKRERPVE